MRRATVAVWLVLVPCVAACVPAGHADEAAIIARIEAFFQTTDVERRRRLVSEIQADPAYNRARVGAWLHRAELFEPLQPGRRRIRVPLNNDQTRAVVLRIPSGYDPHQPWPVIYALHGASGRGEHIIGYVQQVLGERVNEFVIAAPDRYHEINIHHAEWPPTGEHGAALLAVKKTVHVDSDRVYVIGYSMGGHGSWTLAMHYPDQFAAVMPLAGTFNLFLGHELWPVFLPNARHLPVTCIWGAGDIYVDSKGTESPDGGIAGLNRNLRTLAAELGVPVTGIELPDANHSDVVPPPEEVAKFLDRRRCAYPRQVTHTFRDLCQGRAYWLEAHAWAGKQWTSNQISPRFRAEENKLDRRHFEAALARAIRGRLARISGRIDGQTITIGRQKIKELTVWVGDGTIDWEQPIVLEAGSGKGFEGRLDPDLFVCLSQAARTWDFDRLRWAGLRVRSGKKTRLVTAETKFPDLFGRPKAKNK